MTRAAAPSAVEEVGDATTAGSGGRQPVPVRVLFARTGTAPLPEHVLSDFERSRAQSYRRAGDRTLSGMAAALVRVVVGASLGRPPHAVSVTLRCPCCGGSHGPPFVAGGPLLSVSHCNGFAVVAACELPVGVDVEPLSRRGLAQAVGVFLGPDEQRPCDDHGLLRTWVRKEATVKATGVGLRVSLRDVQVTPSDEPAAVLTYGPRPGLAITLTDLPLADVVGAVAVLTDREIELSVQDATAVLAEL